MGKRVLDGVETVGDAMKKRSKGWHCIECGSVWTKKCRQTHIDATKHEVAMMIERVELRKKNEQEENERLMMGEEDIRIPPRSVWAVELDKALIERSKALVRVMNVRNVLARMEASLEVAEAHVMEIMSWTQ